MIDEKYTRIILPVFFLLELFILITIYIIITGFNFSLSIFYTEFIIISISWILPSLYFKSYKAFRTNSIVKSLSPIVKTLLSFAILYCGLIIFIGFNPNISKKINFLFIFYASWVFLFYSFVRFYFFYLYRKSGRNIKHVLLVDPFSNKRDYNIFKNEILYFGYYIRSRLKSVDDLEKRFEELSRYNKIDFIFLREKNKNDLSTVRMICDKNGIRLKLLLNMDESITKGSGLDVIGGFPVLDVRHEPLLYLGNRLIKRLIDLIISVLSILFVLTWLPFIVKIAQIFTYPGPLLFVQDRIGLGGKKFKLYKFRTMIFDSEFKIAKEGRSNKTLINDNRVSKFGLFLRKTNLDEYPQFINVLLGSMSTIGPRPHMVSEDKNLEEKLLFYQLRRFIKPGITGLAAIKGYRGGTDDLRLMERRTNYDIWYLENWTLWLDIKIIVKTIWQMITFKIPKAY